MCGLETAQGEPRNTGVKMPSYLLPPLSHTHTNTERQRGKETERDTERDRGWVG
eukprot:COSAG03_NODE_20200_length_323_cov_0.669643_1_plen_53_part_01